MAWRSSNWIGNTPLHNKWDGWIRTMAETVMFPWLQEFRWKAWKDTQKWLMENLLGDNWVKILNSWWMAEGMISNRAK